MGNKNAAVLPLPSEENKVMVGRGVNGESRECSQVLAERA
jgi:hypothetical protein